jgi:hypothetical protein
VADQPPRQHPRRRRRGRPQLEHKPSSFCISSQESFDNYKEILAYCCIHNTDVVSLHKSWQVYLV